MEEEDAFSARERTIIMLIEGRSGRGRDGCKEGREDGERSNGAEKRERERERERALCTVKFDSFLSTNYCCHRKLDRDGQKGLYWVSRMCPNS